MCTGSTTAIPTGLSTLKTDDITSEVSLEPTGPTTSGKVSERLTVAAAIPKEMFPIAQSIINETDMEKTDIKNALLRCFIL